MRIAIKAPQLTKKANPKPMPIGIGFGFFYVLTRIKKIRQTYLKYDKNPWGDVVGLLDNTGNSVVKYKYDAWGNCERYDSTNITLADLNPTHVHVFGDDIADKAHGIKVGVDGKPLPGQNKLPPAAKKALKKIWGQILKTILK